MRTNIPNDFEFEDINNHVCVNLNMVSNKSIQDALFPQDSTNKQNLSLKSGKVTQQMIHQSKFHPH